MTQQRTSMSSVAASIAAINKRLDDSEKNQLAIAQALQALAEKSSAPVASTPAPAQVSVMTAPRTADAKKDAANVVFPAYAQSPEFWRSVSKMGAERNGTENTAGITGQERSHAYWMSVALDPKKVEAIRESNPDAKIAKANGPTDTMRTSKLNDSILTKVAPLYAGGVSEATEVGSPVTRSGRKPRSDRGKSRGPRKSSQSVTLTAEEVRLLSTAKYGSKNLKLAAAKVGLADLVPVPGLIGEANRAKLAASVR